MAILDDIINKAVMAGKTIVFPEGQDPRVVQAANKVREIGISRSVTVLGSEKEIDESCKEAGLKERLFTALDHQKSDKLDYYIDKLCELRKAKGKNIEKDKAAKVLNDRLYYGAMMTKLNEVDGFVGGSIASTGDMLRASFMVIGSSPNINKVSSSFLMDLSRATAAGNSSLLFADCAVNPDPGPETLVDIGLATAETHRAFIGTVPKVAFLCFSTKGSGNNHPLIKNVIKATELMKNKIEEEKLDIIFDGELQADAALVPKVAASKSPDSELKGEANILIFPDLNVGNICYKLMQRIGGAVAIGPVLQGLAKPVNDLSRGCSVDDIVGVAAITVCQAIKN
ncbi:MAG: phosphate acetyltransferase [Victivallales bacterium]|nr:phosphate acetyltransferase [Victivallales bacterium]